MAKLANKSQRIVTGVMSPQATYSRVVSMAQVLPQPPGDMFCYTEALAQHLWLIGVDVWLVGQGDPQAARWSFTLRRGLTVPPNSLVVRNWEYVLPLLSPSGLWSWHGESTPFHMHWDMMKLFEGQSQRFAAAFNITGPVVSYLQVSFEISEG